MGSMAMFQIQRFQRSMAIKIMLHRKCMTDMTDANR